MTELADERGVTLPAAPGPQPSSVLKPEGQAPLPDRLVGDGHTPLGEEVLDVSKTQAEPVVQPHSVTDDVRRESVSAVAGLRAHRLSLPRGPST